jgi:predicted metal-dependent hydrolase
VLLELFRRSEPAEPAPPGHVMVHKRAVPLETVRHPRARRYLLRLNPDGSARLTIPRGGSVRVAQAFLERHTGWLAKQLERLAARPRKPATWTLGTEIFYRGERVQIEASQPGCIRFADQIMPTVNASEDLRPAIERHLWALAARELPPRLCELAALHGFTVRRVTVRNQRSRWGSCSRRGTISLNWRLIQTPAFVQDYLHLHELAHLRHMNHSARYWAEVERLCPDYETAERWLKQHAALLR